MKIFRWKNFNNKILARTPNLTLIVALPLLHNWLKQWLQKKYWMIMICLDQEGHLSVRNIGEETYHIKEKSE